MRDGCGAAADVASSGRRRGWLARASAAARTAFALALLAAGPAGAIEILAIGDSLTTCNQDWNRWPIRMEALLPPGYDATCAGLPGASVGNWNPDDPTRHLWHDLVPVLQPDWLTIWLGTNDMFFGIPVADYQQALLAMTESASELGIENVVLMTAPSRPGFEALALAYRLAVLEICATTAAACVDVYSFIGPQHKLIDGVHLNEEGDTRVAEAVAVAVPEPQGDLSLWLAGLALAAIGRPRRSRVGALRPAASALYQRR